MKISVIVPVFHGKNYVREIIRMMDENVTNIRNAISDEIYVEIIFVNDSPDEDIDITEICCDKSVCVTCICNERNLGIHQSRVNGLNVAIGEYVLFLDQDDSIESNYFLEQINSLVKNDADWVVCNGIFRSNNIIFPNSETIDCLMSEEQYFESVNIIISPGQVMMKRSSIPDLWRKEILKYNYCDDAFLWILLKNEKKKLAYTDLVLYRHMENGMNASLSWLKNRNALMEFKDVIKRTACISCDNMKIYERAIDIEIDHQSKFAEIEKMMSIVGDADIRRVSDKVVIYGYGIFGKKLHSILDSNGVYVDFIIDRGLQSLHNGKQVYRIEELTPEIALNHKDSMVCITFVEQIDDVQEKLHSLGFEKVITLEEFLKRL